MSAAPTSVTIASSIALRLRNLAQRIHDLGPNPLFQIMCEMSGSSAALDKFEQYGALTRHRDLIRAYSGDTLPPIIQIVK
jgi:hypothetical protein